MKPEVLVIDDSLTVRMDLKSAFEPAGFATTLVGTAAAAREALARRSFGLVVLDVLLPDADGVELLAEIRSAPATARTPVLLLSTEAEVRDRIRGLKTGADDYVGKPYDAAYVVARAKELARRTEPARAAATLPTVLVIDDSLTFREELAAALVSAGYSVLAAASGEEGLRVAADERPGAAIVDGVLPGIDGAMVIRRIRLDAALRGTACLLLTASEHEGGELLALEAGADAYIRKEEGTGVILAHLAAVLRSRGSSGIEAVSSLQGPKRVLAVDDSPTYLNELAGRLREEGYDAILARSGEEALEMLAVQPVDCILLDLVMPGLSGQETCRRIKSRPEWRDIPLVMLTGVEDRSAMIEGFGAGADDYIAKSSDLQVLKARLRAQLRRRQFEDETRRIRDELMHKELEAAEARAARELAEARAVLLAELEAKNQELEAFAYSVSHDLRAPLRRIDGFSKLLLDSHRDRLDQTGRDYLERVRAGTQQMGQLIDDLLGLSRVTSSEMHRTTVDLTALAQEILAELRRADPDREAELIVAPAMSVVGDRRLLAILMENLLGNAWKFTRKAPRARIEVGFEARPDGTVHFVRDNGAGFDMAYAQKLFAPFQRLHSAGEFEGTGIGLATVQRIVARHGGRVWAEGVPDRGASFYFTL
jgi:DNA-binding response OmpR family regulator